MDFLVDALTAAELVRGVAPTLTGALGEESRGYVISYPEYSFLLDIALEVASSGASEGQLSEINRKIDGIVSIADWLSVYLDLAATNEIHGIPLVLAIPTASAARHLVAVRSYYDLNCREATNLLLAEEREIPIVARAESLTTEMRAAIEDRGVALLMAA